MEKIYNKNKKKMKTKLTDEERKEVRKSVLLFLLVTGIEVTAIILIFSYW